MIHYRWSRNCNDLLRGYEIIKDLTESYPDFYKWYMQKIVPDVVCGGGSLLLAEEHNQIIGIAIGKKTATETKFRCLRIVPAYQHKGIGQQLIDRMLLQLDCDKPLITVSHDMIHSYARTFVNYYHFELTEVAKGIYVKDKLEYVFNGLLTTQ